MIVICRRIWQGRASDAWGIRTAGLTTLGIVLALGLCTTGLAQTNATTTIPYTAHDFSTGQGPYYQVPSGDNHCEVCHGPPRWNAADPSPEWLHNQSPLADYDGADWTYAIGDGTNLDGSPNAFGPMAASELTRKCMGCHEGDIAVDDYTGGPATPTVFVSSPKGTDMAFHHPVDILYNTALATAQGALEDPTVKVNPQGGGTIADTLLDGGYIRCDSCHEQHNDRRFDLLGFDPSDDPAKGSDTFDPDGDGVPNPNADSATHKFLKFERLCFNCHTHDQPNDGIQHHIPGRADPFGDVRGSDMNCDLCHYINRGVDPVYGIPDDANGGGPYAACSDCHFQGITRGTPYDVGPDGIPGTADDVPGTYPTMPGGHHGEDPNIPGDEREKPYFYCAACHADPVTGVLTGNDFGTIKAPSCFKCHDDLWTNENNAPPTGVTVAEAVDHDSDPNTPDRVIGTVNEALTFTAVVTGNDDGEILAYQWNFGDGTPPPMPSHEPTASHTYDTTTYRDVYKASVAVTDGVNPPVTYTFDVQIDGTEEPVPDTWAVDVSKDSTVDFNITFEDRSGSLVGSTDETPSQLSFGVEFVGVIFWMELWMDLNNDAFWGTGDMYFGNITRGTGGTMPTPGTMDGVVFRPDGTIDVFSATGGAPAKD